MVLLYLNKMSKLFNKPNYLQLNFMYSYPVFKYLQHKPKFAFRLRPSIRSIIAAGNPGQGQTVKNGFPFPAGNPCFQIIVFTQQQSRVFKHTLF
jgi:hypothetical protein